MSRMSRNHPYLKAHRRWKKYNAWWFSHCKPRLKRCDYSQPNVIFTLSTDIVPSTSKHRQTRRPSLDWYDKFYDGYGSYDKMRNMIDHMETI